MGIGTKIKYWWKSKTTTEKIMTVLGAVGIVGSLCVTADCIYNMERIREDVVKKVDEDVSNMRIQLSVVPKNDGGATVYNDGLKEKFLENPILSKPVESRSQYQMAVDLYNKMDPYENPDMKLTDDMIQDALELAWDLAAIEGKTKDAEDNGILPLQIHD